VIYLNSAFTNRIKHFYTLVILWKAYTQYVFVLSTLRYLAYDFRQQGLLCDDRHTTRTTADAQRVWRPAYTSFYGRRTPIETRKSNQLITTNTKQICRKTLSE